MCRSCTKEMPDLRQVVSDHQRKAHQILRWLCTGGQAAPHLSADRQSERARTEGTCGRSSALKQIYEKRLNTINRYIKRGTLDEDLAEVMKKLAKDKMLQALSNVAYAKGDYEKEMGQAALKKEALKRI